MTQWKSLKQRLTKHTIYPYVVTQRGSCYFLCLTTVSALLWLNEPRHDKTNKMAVRPAKTQISLGIRPAWSLIRVFAVRMKKAWVLCYPLSAQRRLWSDWADAQADLSLRWMHTHFVGFVMSWLKCWKVSPSNQSVFIALRGVIIKFESFLQMLFIYEYILIIFW